MNYKVEARNYIPAPRSDKKPDRRSRPNKSQNNRNSKNKPKKELSVEYHPINKKSYKNNIPTDFQILSDHYYDTDKYLSLEADKVFTTEIPPEEMHLWFKDLNNETL